MYGIKILLSPLEALPPGPPVGLPWGDMHKGPGAEFGCGVLVLPLSAHASSSALLLPSAETRLKSRSNEHVPLRPFLFSNRPRGFPDSLLPPRARRPAAFRRCRQTADGQTDLRPPNTALPAGAATHALLLEPEHLQSLNGPASCPRESVFSEP